MKQNTAEVLKSIKIGELKNYFEQWRKSLDRCMASNGECLDGNWSLNTHSLFVYVRIHTQFL